MNASTQIRFHALCFARRLLGGHWERLGFHWRGLIRGLLALGPLAPIPLLARTPFAKKDSGVAARK